MKKKKLFIAITLSNYLIDRTGTPKVVMSHQVAANDAGIKYVALFLSLIHISEPTRP